MSKTLEDLKAAFAGESQASQKYKAFAKKADEEGYPQVARLFRAASRAETVHANNHLKAMDGIKTTAENLQDAIAGENYEVTSMYPGFIVDAGVEGNKRALTTFRWAMEAEKVHEILYRQALEELGKEASLLDVYLCPVCGYVHFGTPPDKCPICSTPSSRFEEIK